MRSSLLSMFFPTNGAKQAREKKYKTAVPTANHKKSATKSLPFINCRYFRHSLTTFYFTFSKS